MRRNQSVWLFKSREMKIALLGMDDMGDQISDDHLLSLALKSKGHHVEEPSWRADLNWSQFDAVVIRETWDYHLHIDEFIPALERIEASGTPLLNPIDIVKWNSDKRYLKELESKGVKIVPTIFLDRLTVLDLDKNFGVFGDKLIVKPVVSANSLNTIITQEGDTEALNVFMDEPCMIQPFLESIHSVGEYSLYFFEGNFSHAIVKKPQQGDFRVQEDFGGTQESITPSDKLMQAAKAVVKHLPEGTFYARVDLLPDSKEDFVLMELELIEPGMYFRFCDNAAENFANAIEAKLA